MAKKRTYLVWKKKEKGPKKYDAICEPFYLSFIYYFKIKNKTFAGFAALACSRSWATAPSGTLLRIRIKPFQRVLCSPVPVPGLLHLLEPC